jgi:hypothetical protein
MKLKNLYLIIFFCISLYTNAQSAKIGEAILADSESLINDSLKNIGHDNSPVLSVQDSKPNNNGEHVTQEAKLKVSEALKMEETKDVIIQPKK